MGSKDPKPEPSLELPSFRLGRKKKAPQPTEPAPPGTPDGVEDTEDTQGTQDTEDTQGTEGTEDTQVIEPEPQPARQPTHAETPAPAAPPPAPRRKASRSLGRRTPAPDADVTPDAAEEPAVLDPEPILTEPGGADPRPRREFSLPPLPGVVPAVTTGVVVGLLAVLMTSLSLQLCELAKGTTSCGGPGLLLLVAILILLTYAGGWLLRGWRITDPMSTSFLAVGMLAVVTMLFLLEALYSTWMLLVVPLLAAASYALSWWVTAMIVDVEDSSESARSGERALREQ